MAKMAKLLKNGKSQRVRRPESWEEFFRLRDEAMRADPRAFKEFLFDRKDEAAKEVSGRRRSKKLKTEDWTR